jgi:hypothetical protein
MPVVNALARLHRDRKGGLEGRLVLGRHQVEPELVAALRREREADQAAAVSGHEVDRVGRRELRGKRQIALVLAILGIAYHHHPARPDVLDRLLNRAERRTEALRPDGGSGRTAHWSTS